MFFREFSTFTAALLQPLVAKLDPHTIHKASNELDIAKRYGMILLSTRRVADEYAHLSDPQEALELADHLVSNYPAHDFAIIRTEAVALGLPVLPLEAYDFGQQARQLHRKFRDAPYHRKGTNSRIQILSVDELLEECRTHEETDVWGIEHEDDPGHQEGNSSQAAGVHEEPDTEASGNGPEA